MSNTGTFNSYSRAMLLIFLLGAMIASSPGIFAQEIRTLITTPEEREYLDYLREQFLELSESRDFNILEDGIPLIPEVNTNEDDEEETIRYKLSGIVHQSDGSRVVWLNGQFLREDELPSNIYLTEVGGVPALGIRSNDKHYILKSGQTLDLAEGSIREAYQPGGNSE